MDITKFKCPTCGKEVFGLDEDDKKVFSTDEMGIPLFAPTWTVEKIWQEDKYFPVECAAGHESMLFTNSNRIINIKDFNKEMDEKEAAQELADLEQELKDIEEKIKQKAVEINKLKAKQAEKQA